MPFVSSQGQTQLYFEVQGKGKPILFIHPPGMGLVTFKLQQPLSDQFQLVTFDLRGNGKSSSGSEPITIPLLARDILTILNKLALDRVIICGYSNGGSIALEFALENPDRVEGIILIGGFSEVNTFWLRSEFKLGIYTVKMKGISFLAKVLGLAHGTTKEYREEIEAYVKRTNPHILYEMYVKGLEYNCTNRLYQIKVPVLLVDGTLDLYMHSYQKLLEEKIQLTQKRLIPKARHQIPTKFANDLNQIIYDFVCSLPFEHQNRI
ncbi:alpha/beta fold hydrolase [Fredinandcohnia humi]